MELNELKAAREVIVKEITNVIQFSDESCKLEVEVYNGTLTAKILDKTGQRWTPELVEVRFETNVWNRDLNKKFKVSFNHSTGGWNDGVEASAYLNLASKAFSFASVIAYQFEKVHSELLMEKIQAINVIESEMTKIFENARKEKAQANIKIINDEVNKVKAELVRVDSYEELVALLPKHRYLRLINFNTSEDYFRLTENTFEIWDSGNRKTHMLSQSRISKAAIESMINDGKLFYMPTWADGDNYNRGIFRTNFKDAASVLSYKNLEEVK